MLPLSASEVEQATSGTLVSGSGETSIDGIALDTRTINPGDLFIPIKGENYNGHDFLSQALARGACGFLSAHWDDRLRQSLGDKFDSSKVAIVVRNTLKALQEIAKHIRKKLDVQVVGITGSTGKTCSKDMIANVLSRGRTVVSTEKNYNNEIGVPLTILRANQGTEVLVIEMAMRGIGQIAELAEIAQPTIGLVTNVGKTHFEFLGSEEGIAKAKSELIEAVPSDGTIILNADDKWTGKLRDLAQAPVVTYGISQDSDVRAEDISVNAQGWPSFRIVSGESDVSVSLPFPGRHNVYNALAAYAVASTMHLSKSGIKRGLETCVLAKMRMQIFSTPDGITVLNDAYNANPTSMKAALITLRDLARRKRKLAVLGDMLELGTLSEMAHFKIGELASDLKIDLLIAVGAKSKRIADGALSKGMNSSSVFSCSTTKEASAVLAEKMRPGDAVLIKASRGMELEQVVNVLV